MIKKSHFSNLVTCRELGNFLRDLADLDSESNIPSALKLVFLVLISYFSEHFWVIFQSVSSWGIPLMCYITCPWHAWLKLLTCPFYIQFLTTRRRSCTATYRAVEKKPQIYKSKVGFWFHFAGFFLCIQCLAFIISFCLTLISELKQLRIIKGWVKAAEKESSAR